MHCKHMLLLRRCAAFIHETMACYVKEKKRRQDPPNTFTSPCQRTFGISAVTLTYHQTESCSNAIRVRSRSVCLMLIHFEGLCCGDYDRPCIRCVITGMKSNMNEKNRDRLTCSFSIAASREYELTPITIVSTLLSSPSSCSGSFFLSLTHPLLLAIPPIAYHSFSPSSFFLRVLSVHGLPISTFYLSIHLLLLPSTYIDKQ